MMSPVRLLLDSASIADATKAIELGIIQGITTNPSLLRQETRDPLAHLKELLAVSEIQELYYQPTGAYECSLAVELHRAREIGGPRVIAKVPATPTGARLARECVGQGMPVVLTAAQWAGAAILAEAVGADGVIPYVDRAQRDIRCDSSLIRSLRTVTVSDLKIVAASIKTAAQAIQAFIDGADGVTAPLTVLEELLVHPAAVEAEQAFLRAFGLEAAREI